MKTALVLGASGGVGGETARALVRRGWRVRGMSRAARSGDDIEWIVGDALDGPAVMRAAQGADVLLHAVNPPGYRDWDKLVLPMADNAIAAARAAGARFALPGTIYNYDPTRYSLVSPDTPQHGVTRKGAIRVELERRIAAASDGTMRGMILRAGNFFGPRAGGSWFSQGLVKPGRPVQSVWYPGAKGVGYAWAYLPDVGEAFAALLDREHEFPPFVRHHFAGYWDPDGTAMIRAIGRAAGRPDIPVRPVPWALLPLAGLFNVTMRELREMHVYWQHPLKLDNSSLLATLGSEPHTPLDEAVTNTLRALACID